MKKLTLFVAIFAFTFASCSQQKEQESLPQSSAESNAQNTDTQQSAPQQNVGIEVGNAAPNFTMNNTEGKPVSLSQFKGKTVVIDFWATWCPPCRRSIPYVKESYEKFKNNNVEFIGISLDKQDGLDGWKEYIKENQMNWVQVADGKFWDNDVAVRYGIESIPSMWVINRNGIIIGKNIAHDELDATITKAIQQ
jgi:peroxiredoxin